MYLFGLASGINMNFCEKFLAIVETLLRNGWNEKLGH